MAEERIFIEVKAINPCVECTTFANCQMPCEKQKKWVESGYGYGLFTEVTMTRQEAIEKIEKHLKASTIKFSTTPDVVAEISLNALLEVEK